VLYGLDHDTRRVEVGFSLIVAALVLVELAVHQLGHSALDAGRQLAEIAVLRLVRLVGLMGLA
jgi:hypothetical protein